MFGSTTALTGAILRVVVQGCKSHCRTLLITEGFVDPSHLEAPSHHARTTCTTSTSFPSCIRACLSLSLCARSVSCEACQPGLAAVSRAPQSGVRCNVGIARSALWSWLRLVLSEEGRWEHAMRVLDELQLRRVALVSAEA